MSVVLASFEGPYGGGWNLGDAILGRFKRLQVFRDAPLRRVEPDHHRPQGFDGAGESHLGVI